jgi:hypothetical protein
MNSPNLKNLAKIGKLKKEQVRRREFDGRVTSGRRRPADAHLPAPSMESRFDLAGHASHALALSLGPIPLDAGA